MTTTVVRTADHWYVVTGSRAARVVTGATTTGDLLTDREALDKAAASEDLVDVGSLPLVSPITAPCRVVAQMTNFKSHIKDAGMDPASVPLTFFRKTSGSISGPFDEVVKPAHVRLLDYEAEVGLVVAKALPVGTSVTAENLADYVAGFVITNDVSARDLQLPRTQFFESKSYPTFTPVGPALVLVDADELERFDDLHLELRVNGEVRQSMRVGDDILYRPLEAIQALMGFQRLDAGDLLLTGTPVGTALSAPPKIVELIASLLPVATKWRLFFDKQAENPKYLHDGDLIEISVGTPDGAIDLGRMRTKVRYAS